MLNSISFIFENISDFVNSTSDSINSISDTLVNINESLNSFDYNLLVAPIISIVVVFLTLYFERKTHKDRIQMELNNKILGELNIMLRKMSGTITMPKPHLVNSFKNLNNYLNLDSDKDYCNKMDAEASLLFGLYSKELDNLHSEINLYLAQLYSFITIVDKKSKLYILVDNLINSLSNYQNSLYKLNEIPSLFHFPGTKFNNEFKCNAKSIENFLEESSVFFKNDHPSIECFKILLDKSNTYKYKDV